MTLAKYPLLLILFSGSLFAQRMSHPVIPTLSGRDDAFLAPRPLMAAPDTVDILAVMVQFQIDADSRTSGNGQFVLSAPSDSIIDAPPRNRQYFEDHLTFVANYYRKASKGKVIIHFSVVDSTYTLPWVMSVYSPPRNGPYDVVGNLARDAWQMVDASGRVPDFSAYDCFIVFHAGVGRDVDLVAALGFDPTPLDIPSLYLGLNAFRSFYGQNYPGIVVNNGQDTITNSIIVPETESRLIPAVGGNVLLELGINGLLCASVGNFLGLPDLFDTNTGRSGIGRFGLMDGQAIFSFFGVFPPEPSAWEKYWLGWIDPIVVTPGTDTLILPAVGISDTVYRVPISAQEYFLIENRNRDPDSLGQTITSTFNGVARQQSFLKDTIGFNAFDISGLAGVIIDVEDLDWSVPGGVDQNGVFFNGGALIWHIDETVIAQSLASNGVNANPQRRGVDLEEADGSQDIGQEYGFLDPGSGSEEGTPLDFWFAGNNAPVFRNVFSPTSFPDSRSNGGANSHITISRFSPRGPRMSTVVSLGDDQISPMTGFPKSIGEYLTDNSLTVADLNSEPGEDIVVATTGHGIPGPFAGGEVQLVPLRPPKIFAWGTDGQPVLSSTFSSGFFASNGAVGATLVGSPAVRDLSGDGIPELVIGQTHFPTVPIGGGAATNATLLGFSAVNANTDSLADNFFSLGVTRSLTTPAVVGDSIIAFGGLNGRVYFLRLDGSLIDSLSWVSDSTARVTGVSLLSRQNGFILTGSDGTVSIIARTVTGGVITPEPTVSVGRQIVGPAVAGILAPSLQLMIAFASSDGFLYLTSQSLETRRGFPIDVGGPITQPPALADIDGDGLRDIIVFTGNKMHAYNYAGASLDYFPITVRSTRPLTSAPIIGDVNGDGDVEVVGVTNDGLVFAYDKRGMLAPGFPLQAGIGNQSVAILDIPGASLSEVGIGLVVTSSDGGSVSAWQTGRTRFPYVAARVRPWPQYQKDAQHTGLATEPLTGTPLSSEFFPSDRAYNWPNPVYEGTTHIRYFVQQDATVNVKVFDLAGDLVAQFSDQGIGGVDNDVLWDVSGIQSGIYFARIEAKGLGGSGVAVVKVAVVK